MKVKAAHKKILYGALFCSVVVVVGIGVFWSRHLIGRNMAVLSAHILRPKYMPFPDIESSELNETQQRIVAITKTEYGKRPISFDTNVLHYTENNQEPWCADFTSWVMREAKVPLINPHSGHWRIPGVLTLLGYYKNTGRFRAVGTYTPKPGDTALYNGTGILDALQGQHVNIVLRVENDTMTTIGGNENGTIQIRQVSLRGHKTALIGFGAL